MLRTNELDRVTLSGWKGKNKPGFGAAVLGVATLVISFTTIMAGRIG